MEIPAFGKTWVLESYSDERLVFVPMKEIQWTQKKGYKGTDNFLKSWRVRTDRYKPKRKGETEEKREKWTQQQAAEFFDVSQEFVSMVESGKKKMTEKMQKVVFGATEGELKQAKKELEETVNHIRARHTVEKSRKLIKAKYKI